ncbi:MAG: SH3 domain-containing protein [Pontiellaceae bacterium]
MRRWLCVVCFWMIAISEVLADVRVTGDRVSLRTAPSLEAGVLDRAMRGDVFKELGRSNEWVAIEAPEYVDAWVSESYLTNGVVIPNRLNVRSGPNRNYAVLTVVEEGTKLEELDRFHAWVKVAPPKGSRVWIHVDYTESVPSEVGELVEEPGMIASEYVAFDEVELVLPVLPLELDTQQDQGLEQIFVGRLDRANPGLYRLLSAEDQVLCLVRGRMEQLETLVDRWVGIEGLVYFIKASALPVLQPNRIVIDPLVVD